MNEQIVSEKDVVLLVAGAVLGFALTALSQFVGDMGRFSGFGGKTSVEQEANEYKNASEIQRSIIMQEYYFAAFRYLVLANIFWALAGVAGPMSFSFGFFLMSVFSMISVLLFLLSLGRMLRFQRVRRNSHSASE